MESGEWEGGREKEGGRWGERYPGPPVMEYRSKIKSLSPAGFGPRL